MQCQSTNAMPITVLTLLVHSDILLYSVHVYKRTVTQFTQVYSCISIIKAQRAHNNYINIILKEPNENPQRAHLGPGAPLWTTLFYNVYVNRRYSYQDICPLNVLSHPLYPCVYKPDSNNKDSIESAACMMLTTVCIDVLLICSPRTVENQYFVSYD